MPLPPTALPLTVVCHLFFAAGKKQHRPAAARPIPRRRSWPPCFAPSSQAKKPPQAMNARLPAAMLYGSPPPQLRPHNPLTSPLTSKTFDQQISCGVWAAGWASSRRAAAETHVPFIGRGSPCVHRGKTSNPGQKKGVGRWAASALLRRALRGRARRWVAAARMKWPGAGQQAL